MTQTIPKVYVTRFFQLVATRQFAEAERVLERLKQRIKMSERNRGYFQALYGMLLAQKNNDDRYAFLSNLNFQDKKELQSYRREFKRQSEYRLHADYDRGFFSAWADFTRILSKLESLSAPVLNKNNVQRETQIEEAEQEIKEVSKEILHEETGVEETEMPTEAREKQTENTERAGEVRNVEPRQSTLVDFSR